MNHGLTSAQARERLQGEGPNELRVSRPRSLIRLAADILSEPMFLLLVACGAIYAALGDRAEAAMLIASVVAIMAITFFQQRRTERALEALRDLSSPRALVMRDGVAARIAGREVVRGDLVLLAEGDRVPADLRIVEASNLSIDESMLTGESAPVAKHAPEGEAAETGKADSARAFSGTLVTLGTARGIAVATGPASALGKIGESLHAIGGGKTPIQAEMRRVVLRVAAVGLAIAAVLAVTYGIELGDWLRGVLAGLTFAMAVLPEELPVALTLFMGLGAWRLVRENVLARSIPAIELLGATTVLCVDKTGTLTTNRMIARCLWSPESAYEMAGTQAAPLPGSLHALLEFAVLASHRRAFDPMESAIAEAGGRLLGDTDHLHPEWTPVRDYPLSPRLLAMSRVWLPADGRRIIAAKGAPEAILDLCHVDTLRREQIAAHATAMAGDGLRVLGVARAIAPPGKLPADQHDFAFEFLGLLALEDPVRADVPQAIAECRAAGIRVVMITGDHPATAVAIARQAGLPADGGYLTGTQLASMSDGQLQARMKSTSIFCRVHPEQKLRLVRAFRAAGEVVAMTGDGVNDAPALKAADIGVAMGARGSDVAREAAALVLLADDFASLVTAVRYGRRIFANLHKAIVFILAVHVPIVGLSILPAILGWPILLLPAHVLFLELIIDPACSMVFEAEALESGAMRMPPRPRSERLFGRAVVVRGLVQGLGLFALLGALYVGSRLATGSDAFARTLTFTALVLANLPLIYANRAWSGTSWRRHAPSNLYFAGSALSTLAFLSLVLFLPEGQRLFAFVAPDGALLATAAGAAMLALFWFEGVKWWLGRELRQAPAPQAA
jgi:P-type Ca2+ transporter type 2C